MIVFTLNGIIIGNTHTNNYGMVICTYIFKSSRKNALSIREILNSVKISTWFKPGCISFNIWRSEDNTGIIMLLEEWESVEHMKEYLFSAQYRKVLEAMEMCSEKPEIKIRDCNTTRNFTWLKQEIAEQPKEEDLK